MYVRAMPIVIRNLACETIQPFRPTGILYGLVTRNADSFFVKQNDAQKSIEASSTIINCLSIVIRKRTTDYILKINTFGVAVWQLTSA